ncbi:MAG: recombination regulator RecX [Caldimonas manganoxidans]|jgi:regulatory protein|uniref:recombination regulator RecX n=1 Tax=Caldimonas TaxID=196013 RepID=UPI000363E408|nr:MULTISPECIES: recombination regulator RecX [Caldimonas]MCX7660896.1 recombination regulator RecX [Caldimonas manganoxidans]
MGMPPLSLKGRALKYLARREHSRLELARKLAPHAQSPDEVEAVLDALQAAGWLSPARFVESVVHRKAARFGTARIRQELQGHGLSGEAVTEVLQALSATEFERARAVWARRFGGEAALDPAERARQMRFLAARGFSPEVIRRVVRGDG